MFWDRKTMECGAWSWTQGLIDGREMREMRMSECLNAMDPTSSEEQKPL